MYAVSGITAIIAIVIAMQDFTVMIITAIFVAALVVVLQVYRKRTAKAKKEEDSES